MNLGHTLSERIKIGKPFKGFIGGLILILLSLIFSSRYLGLGMDTIHQSLQGGDIPWYSFLVKTIFTSVTLNFGGSGGIVTPIFFIGTTSGALFANIFGISSSTFAAIGLVSLLAGAANTPIAASIMAVEIFGPKIAPYASLACVISFLMTGHRSVYPSQVMAIKKSSSIKIEVGLEVEKIKPQFVRRSKSLIGTITYFIKTIEKRFKQWRK
jgi:H+/Cl- antiporter ClcA